MPTISVIVPVYDVEDYLPQCIDSILCQSFTELELILVDDDSPDNCGAICDEYAAKDQRIRVIHQKNAGVSAARNAGIDISKGDYLAFIDSDDVIRRDYLLRLMQIAIDTGAQISVCQLCEFEDNKEPPEQQVRQGAATIYTGHQAALNMYSERPVVQVSPCCKLYEASLLSKYRFPVGMRHEDQAIVPIIVSAANRVAVIKDDMYCYRLRSKSFMHSRFSAKRYDDIIAVEQCITYFQANEAPELVAAAQRKRRELLSVYSLLARKDHVYAEVPKQYRISEYKALKWLRDNLSDDKYTYQLAKVHPNWLRPHAYWRKIKKMLHIPCN